MTHIERRSAWGLRRDFLGMYRPMKAKWKITLINFGKCFSPSGMREWSPSPICAITRSDFFRFSEGNHAVIYMELSSENDNREALSNETRSFNREV